MANTQHQRRGRLRPSRGREASNPEKHAERQLSGRQRRKARRARRQELQRAKGLAQVLGVKNALDVVDPRASLLVPPTSGRLVAPPGRPA